MSMKELEEGEERPLETLEELVEALESDDNGKLDITIKGKNSIRFGSWNT